MNKYYIVGLLLSAFSLTEISQVHINGYSASNLNSFVDSYGKTEDWIELYNSSSTAVDHSGWHLSDKISKPEKWKNQVISLTNNEPNSVLRYTTNGTNPTPTSSE